MDVDKAIGLINRLAGLETSGESEAYKIAPSESDHTWALTLDSYIDAARKIRDTAATAEIVTRAAHEAAVSKARDEGFNRGHRLHQQHVANVLGLGRLA